MFEWVLNAPLKLVGFLRAKYFSSIFLVKFRKQARYTKLCLLVSPIFFSFVERNPKGSLFGLNDYHLTENELQMN